MNHVYPYKSLCFVLNTYLRANETVKIYQDYACLSKLHCYMYFTIKFILSITCIECLYFIMPMISREILKSNFMFQLLKEIVITPNMNNRKLTNERDENKIEGNENENKNKNILIVNHY